jgi:hypothetical protein
MMESAKVYTAVPVDDVEAATKTTMGVEDVVLVEASTSNGTTTTKNTLMGGRKCLLVVSALGLLALLHMHFVGCHHRHGSWSSSSSGHQLLRSGEISPSQQNGMPCHQKDHHHVCTYDFIVVVVVVATTAAALPRHCVY